MSVWRNEQDFMRNMDNMLSEFYIKDKKGTAPKKLNVQTQKQDRLWYDSESDDDINEKPQNVDGSSKCPSMEPMDTLQMMQSIRTQVRNVVGGRYSNDVLESYYRMNQEPESEPSTTNEVFEGTVPVAQPEVNDLSSIAKDLTALSMNGHKIDASKPLASGSKSKADNSSYVHNKPHSRGKYSNRGGGRRPSRYHHNVAFASLQSKESYNYASNNDFPPL